jgi:hypothetical protein
MVRGEEGADFEQARRVSPRERLHAPVVRALFSRSSALVTGGAARVDTAAGWT